MRGLTKEKVSGPDMTHSGSDKPMTSPHERTSALRVCLAGSGGGHVRQLLDLEPAWGPHDYFFVSEDTALTQSIAKQHRTLFVPHFALGQARLGKPLRMAVSGVRNFFASAKIVIAERPDVVITTGAGAVFWSVIWARIFGARIILVESFARFNAPSVFGKLTAPLAHHKIAQSGALSKHWPDAKVFDPLKLVATPRPPKKPLLFATVGAILPFDRLVTFVSEAKARGLIKEEVVAQVGVGGAKPQGIATVETLPFDEMQRFLRDADIVVCHGGTGSLITALRQGCRVIAVPRLFEFGEVYDDHQEEITAAFAERGMIKVAKTPEEFAEALSAARAAEPISATSEPAALAAYLRSLLDDVTSKRRRGGSRPRA